MKPPWLFDPLPRIDTRLPTRCEDDFDYLNTSGRTWAAVVRLNYRTWFDRYPKVEKAEFVARFRSPNRNSHVAAAFELVVHEVLGRLGAEVRVPPISAGAPRHDFDAARDGEDVALEASLVTSLSDEDRARQQRVDAVLDALDHVRHDRFATCVWECLVDPARPPPIAKLRASMFSVFDSADERQITDWVAKTVARRFQEIPRWTYERGATRIVFSPVPRPPGGRPRHQVESPSTVKAMEQIVIGDAMLEKIREKASKRYTVNGRPLVLALGVTHWAGAGEWDVFRALYGTEKIPVHVAGPGEEPIAGTPYRDRDGAWGPHSRHKITSVDAVLVFERFRVWSPWGAGWKLYVNPWSTRALPGWLMHLPRWVAEGDELRFHEGVALSALLESVVAPPPFGE